MKLISIGDIVVPIAAKFKNNFKIIVDMTVQELHRQLADLIKKGKAHYEITKNIDDLCVEEIHRVVDCDKRIILD